MVYKPTKGERLFDVFNYGFMIFLMFIMLYPLVYVISLSMSSPAAINAMDVTFYPKGFNLNAYFYIFTETRDYIVFGYRNTIIYAAANTLLMLVVTSLVAYALSIGDFVLKKPITIILSITMFFSGGLIPTYLLIRSLNLINTMWVMILPGCVSAYTVFVFRTFFQQLPVDLRESAIIDGANDFFIWFRITIPLSKPIIATYSLFNIVGVWNSWFGALLYLKDEHLYPIQMFLRRIVVNMQINTMYGNTEVASMLAMGKVHSKNIQMSMIVIALLPILFVYPFVQKHFMKGVLIGAIKG